MGTFLIASLEEKRQIINLILLQWPLVLAAGEACSVNMAVMLSSLHAFYELSRVFLKIFVQTFFASNNSLCSAVGTCSI